MADMEAIAESLTQLLATYGGTRDEIADLLGGPADGGPNGNGLYRITLPAGGDVLVPSPARYAADLRDLARSGRIAFTSWSALEAAESPLDTVAEVGADEGTHTDPVTGAVVANSGTYKREQAGWRWLYPSDSLLARNAADLAVTAAERAETAAAPLAGAVDRIAAIEAVIFASRLTSLSAVPALIEFGFTGGVRVEWTVTYAPTAFRLAGVRYPADARSANLQAPWTADRAITLEMLDADDVVIDARTITIYARVPVFADLCAGPEPAPNEIRAAAYKSLDSAAIGRTIVLNRTVGGRPFFVFSAALTPTTLKLGGFAVTGWAVSAPFDLVLDTGATVSMRRVVLDPLPASTASLGAELA